jgi:ABC-type glycerol-3-phosphate transport system permease component
VGQKKRKLVSKILNIMVQSVLVFCIMLPFYFMLISSFKLNAEISANYFGFPDPIRFENYAVAFSKVVYYLLNSIFVCTVSVAGVTVFACIAAFIFAKYQFPGKNLLYYFYLSFLMIPGVLTLIPQFTLIVKLNLMGSYMAVILPYIAFGQIMFAFVLRSFIEGIPQDLFDSARIDGAKPYQSFLHVVLPLSRQIIISMAFMNFLANWNDFIWPLLVLRGEKMKTVTVGLYSFTDAQQVQYGMLFAGFIISSLPIILLFGYNMKYFINGLLSGAVKG